MNLNAKISFSNPFSFKGRTQRLGMWCFGLPSFILFVIISIVTISSEQLWLKLFYIPLIWLFWATAVRRLHDHDLSGNWLFFLTPAGSGLMYMAYVLDLDESVKPIAEKIEKSSPVIGWLFAAIAWFFVAWAVLLCILFLCAGKAQDNRFGANPYR